MLRPPGADLLIDSNGDSNGISPVCSIFAGIGAHNVARQLRDTPTTAGIMLPERAKQTDDPLRIAGNSQGH